MKPDSGISRIIVFNVQESTGCPEEVYQQVEDIWRWQRLDNDTAVYKTTIERLKSLDLGNVKIERWVELDYSVVPNTGGWTPFTLRTNAIVQYLEEQGVPADEEIWIHWWW